jgi:pimeloyl-ACP methyl ester carboxylesterase
MRYRERKHEMAIEREVVFESGSVHLAGTMILPQPEGRSPGVILIPGSGPIDRNENSKKISINAFREIANYLAGEGIASLRYDKRGVGKSEGDYWRTGFYDNVSDASAALSFLKSQDGIQSSNVFLLGHSEGALISTRLAGMGEDVAGVILLAGAAQSGEEILLWQAEQVMKGLKGLNKWLIDHLPIDFRKAQRKQIEKIKSSTKDWYRMRSIARLNAKWMREFIFYNPAEDLSKIQVPVLAITGTKDIQVNPDDLDRMAELVESDFEWHKVVNLTHMLRTELGQPTLSTYKEQVRHPIDKRILLILSDWFHRHLQQKAPTLHPMKETVGL